MAECHPVAFRWVMQAKLKGAKVIHVDPRFTRTTAMADIYAPIRAGSDIVFLGGLINYVINSERWNTSRSSRSTSSPTPTPPRSSTRSSRTPRRPRRRLLRARSSTRTATGAQRLRRPVRPGDLAVRARPPSATRAAPPPPPSRASRRSNRASPAKRTRFPPARPTTPWCATCCQTAAGRADPTLQDPRCVFQILKRHFARYTPEMVERGHRLPAGAVRRGGRDAAEQLRPRQDLRHLLRGRLDAAHQRRADDRHRGACCSCCWATSAGPAAASWRCAATPPSRAPPTSPPSTTPSPATCRRRPCSSTHDTLERLHQDRDAADRLLGQLPQVHRQLAEGDVRRRRHRRERLRLRLAPAHRRRPLAHADVGRHGRGQGPRHVRHGPEPGRRRPERALPAARRWPSSTGWWSTTTSRPRRPPSGKAPEVERRRDPHRGHPDRGLLLPLRPGRRDGRQLHQHPAPGASGTTRRSTRPATPAPTSGSPTTSACG